MKILMVASLTVLLWAPGWLTDFSKARDQATREHKQILLNFSGSDWCGPCIRMEKDFFESESFQQLAKNKLVLLNADFPRLSKHALSPQQQQQNDALAAKYNPEGIFPCTLLLDASGRVLKTWKGFPKEEVGQFLEEINTIVGDAR